MIARRPFLKWVFALWLGTSAAARPGPTGLRDALMPLFPPKLQKILPGSTRAKEARALLGAPASASTDGSALYYELAGKKYDTTVGLSGGKVSYVLFAPESSRIGPGYTIEGLSSFITADQVARAFAEALQAPISHDSGRYLVIPWPSEGLRLKFLAETDRKKLVSILVLPPERAEP